jgi:hypothetical protein
LATRCEKRRKGKTKDTEEGKRKRETEGSRKRKEGNRKMACGARQER